MTAFIAVVLLPLIAGACAVLRIRIIRRSPAVYTGILFHDIPTSPRSNKSFVTADTFRTFITRLHDKGWSTYTAARHTANLDKKSTPDAKQIVLAFDDGLDSCCSIAAPLLNSRGFTASFFPIVNMIGTSGSFDVFGARKHADKATLREMILQGHEIGSHTVSHPDCSRLSNQVLATELSDSRKRLEDLLDSPVSTISFPYGSCTARVWSSALDAGYKSGVIYGPPRKWHDHRLICVQGSWAFDTVDDLISRITEPPHSNSSARADIMPHFARGTALWRFRREYSLIRH